MVLKIPKTSIEGVDLSALEETRLADQLVFTSKIGSPSTSFFKVNSVDFDSIKLAKQQIQRDGYIRISTEFYAGVEMALDSAQRLGISVALDVFDTETNPQTTSHLLRANDFSQNTTLF